MSESMVERVARAIGVPEKEGYLCDWSLRAARAAIEAMREPTTKMAEAGSNFVAYGDHGSIDVWKSMIDAGLIEKLRKE